MTASMGGGAGGDCFKISSIPSPATSTPNVATCHNPRGQDCPSKPPALQNQRQMCTRHPLKCYTKQTRRQDCRERRLHSQSSPLSPSAPERKRSHEYSICCRSEQDSPRYRICSVHQKIDKSASRSLLRVMGRAVSTLSPSNPTTVGRERTTRRQAGVYLKMAGQLFQSP